MSTLTNIRDNAVLVSLTISTWAARKYDKKVTNEVNAKHGAVADAGRYSKHLLPGDAPSYQALVKHLTQCRHLHYEETLTWVGEGDRVLPKAKLKTYRDLFDQRKTEMEALLSAFVADYPSLKATAKQRLNGMYRDEDYPSASEIRSKFQLQYEFSPIPDADFSRVAGGMLRSAVADMERQFESRVERATKLAMDDAWTRLYSCVQHFHERLAQPGAVFRDSLVENVREVCGVLGALNVVNDPELERMRQTTEQALLKHTPDTLRNDDRLRGRMASTAEDIMQTILGTRRILPRQQQAA